MGVKEQKKINKKKKAKKAPAADVADTKADLANQSLDDFLGNWDDDSGDETSEPATKKVKSEDKTSHKKAKSKTKTKEKEKKTKANPAPVEDEEEGESDEDGSESEEEESSGAKSQKKYIKSLKDKDPEFYKFLKEEDKDLLNFDESSDDDEKSGSEDEEDVHQLPDKLEVASDESDFEDEEVEAKYAKSGKITRQQVDAWTAALDSEPGQKVISEVIDAFKAAVSVIGSGESEEEPSKYRVEGGTMFNAVVRMCVVNLYPALKKFLKQGDSGETSFKPEKGKKWKKIEKCVRIYLTQLCNLLSRISEPSVAVVVLKHVHQMIPFFQAYPKGEKQLLARMITCWCQGEETVRILALMCIVRIVRGSNLLETAIKQMYMAYVKNCKFTSPSTLPHINFMRRSLVEVLGLDHNLAYYQAFVHIRQLAIHLRNAIVNNKKDSLQAVYNWQYIHSLELWGALLGHTAGSDVLQPLIFPLVQVVLGVIRLVPTGKYFPLRFHCATILSDLSSATRTFIPILPIYLDILNHHNFEKKSKKVSMKPLDFSTILKLSKSQLSENGFKDATIEEICGGMITYLAANSNKIGFPELVTPLIFQLKDFLKKCKVGNYSKKIKQILDKVISNQKFIETRRKTVSFSVADKQAIQIWEAQVERDGTPMLAFYKSWKKIDDSAKMKKITQQANLDDYSHIPALKKNHKKIRMKMETEAPVDGFLSGSDDEIDDEERFKPKEERGKGDAAGKRKRDEEEDEEESDEEEATNGHAESEEEASDDEIDEDHEDEVQDLRLEDMDSDSDLELKDDFGDESDDGEDTGSDDEDDEQSDE